MNLHETLLGQCVTAGDRVAFIEVDTGESVTFSELRARVDACAARLQTLSIVPRDTVIIHLYNSIDAVVVHLAAQKLGAVSCFVDALVQPASLRYYADKAKAKLLLTHLSREQIPHDLEQATTVMEVRALFDLVGSLEVTAQQEPYAWGGDDVRFIYFTSGTTSQPKGVMLSSNNHDSFVRICRHYWQPVDSESRHLCFVPFSHGFGTVFLVPMTLWTGGCLYIMRAFHPLKVLDCVRRCSITHIYGVPSHYQQLLRLPDAAAILSQLKMAFCAAAKLEHELTLRWENTTGVSLAEGYGLIETCCGTVWRVHEPSLGTGHMGPCPDPALVEIGILDEDNRPLPAGHTGEIAVRGPSVMRGYLADEAETRRVMVDGWLKTGDQGYVSAENQLFMTGRIKDVINIAGIKVSPYEVEAVLNAHPEVMQSVVVAVSDPLYGEVVKAYVQRHAGQAVDERTLIRFAAQHLISFQVPKRIEFVERFPLNNMGKIDRVALRADNSN
ncbi:MAG TPA: class I adenylate-forming enzyme family protein [Polyangiaceae bacterium]